MESDTGPRNGIRNLHVANQARSTTAAARDREIASRILDDPRLATCPLPSIAVATARARHPDTASWADIATALGCTKYQAAGRFRRLACSLGYRDPHPSDRR